MFWRRFSAVLRSRRFNRDLEEEMRLHVAMRAAKLRDKGMSAEEAATAARRRFGNTLLMKEVSRDMWGWTMIDQFLQDVKYGARMMRRSAGFSITAVLVLALGIGATTAIFSVVNRALLQPLPYREADRLVVVYEALGSFSGPIGVSPPDYAYFEKHSPFASLAAYVNTQHELSGAGEPERVTGARVSAGLFPLLGVTPALGRGFTSDEDRPGSSVVVISHGLWRRKFGGDPAVVGRTITLERRPYTIVGVMGPDFEFPHRGPRMNNTPADLWVPLAFTDEELGGWVQRYNHAVVARLRPGATIAQAQQQCDALAAQLLEVHYPPELRQNKTFSVKTHVWPLRDEITRRSQLLLPVLMGAVGMVLLIACADVANLSLTRAVVRRREMAVRSALGAGQRRLITQLLTESLLLALIGGALGLLFAWAGTGALASAVPNYIPRADGIRIDGWVLAFTAAVSIGAALSFGLVPALDVARRPAAATLQEGVKGSAGPQRHRILHFLMVAQVSLSLVLLIGAGLLARSFFQLLATDPGFRPENSLSFKTSLPATSYRQASDIRGFYQTLIENIKVLPGVTAVGASTDLPLAVRERRSFNPENAAVPVAQINVSAHSWILGDAFEAMGAIAKRGRFLDSRDGSQSERVTVVNETLARRYWPGQDPIGKRVRWGRRTAPWWSIVGVVADIKHGPLEADVVPQSFQPYDQVGDDVVLLREMNIIVRTSGNPALLANALRSEVRRLDAALPVVDLQTLDRYVSRSVASQRFNSYLLGAFALFSVLLAAMGLYGVLSYAVTQRTQEIGIRVALGARPADILWTVLSRGLVLAGIGVVIGLGGAAALSRWLSTLLYGVTPHDPATFTLVPVGFLFIALLACYVPARRATRLEPSSTLR